MTERRELVRRGLAIPVVVALAAGCGGPSPQDAEDYARDQYEDRGVPVESVYCREGSGERFECQVTVRIPGRGPTTDNVLVEESELP